MNWIAFFSQTGSEILNISRRLNVYPNKIICNGGIGKINKELIQEKPVIFTRSTPTVDDYFNLIGKGLYRNDTLITLHGWLRILPKEICEYYNNIFNLHPGLITEYPELKGKDPQIRAFEGNYKNIGVVLHKVIPEVDEGEIIIEKSMPNNCNSVDDIYNILHDMASDAWVDFLKNEQQLV